MKTIKKLSKLAATGVLMSAFALNFNACTEQSPLDSSKTGNGELNFLKIGESVTRLSKKVSTSEFVTYKDGGELIVEYKGIENDNGAVEAKLTLKVFSETISEDAELVMSLDDQVLVGNVDVGFEPHGITFSSPALLTIEAKSLDLSGVNPHLINIYYDNPETGEWELMNSYGVIVKTEDGYVKIIDAELPHFSRYAVAWSN